MEYEGMLEIVKGRLQSTSARLKQRYYYYYNPWIELVLHHHDPCNI